MKTVSDKNLEQGVTLDLTFGKALVVIATFLMLFVLPIQVIETNRANSDRVYTVEELVNNQGRVAGVSTSQSETNQGIRTDVALLAGILGLSGLGVFIQIFKNSRQI